MEITKGDDKMGLLLFISAVAILVISVVVVIEDAEDEENSVKEDGENIDQK